MNRNQCHDFLIHYGTPRHSGRYPWGSGDRPYQDLEGRSGSKRKSTSKKSRVSSTGSSKASSKNSSSKTTTDKKSETKERSGMSTTKKVLIGLGVVTVAAAAAYVGYKHFSSKGSASELSNLTGELKAGADVGLRVLDKSESLNQCLKEVNPYYKQGHSYQVNCGLCCSAFELRNRGFDVVAKGSKANGTTKLDMLRAFKINDKDIKSVTENLDKRSNHITNQINDIYDHYDNTSSIDTKLKTWNKLQSLYTERSRAVYDGVCDEIRNMTSDDNARGMLFVTNEGSSHWINWVKTGNDIKIVDAQNSSYNVRDNLFQKWYKNPEVATTIFRTDNAEINYSEIKNFVDNRLEGRGSLYEKHGDLNISELKAWEAQHRG